MLRRSGWAAAVLTTVWGACAVSEPVVEQDVSELVAGDPCPDFGCGTNSPVIDSLGFHELSLIGLPNKQGFFILPRNAPAQIVKGVKSYDLRVSNGIITGSIGGVTWLSGRALVGATISIQRGSARYSLTIRDVRTMAYFVDPRTTPLETYKLEWVRAGDDHFQNLCNNVQLLEDEGFGDPGATSPETMGMAVWEALVFEGDRIDSVRKTMSKLADDKWFNIACATSAPSKLLLTHHTIHSQVAQPRAWEQRQATFKMYVADYCNTGDSFTVPRQKLVWQSSTLPYLHPPLKIEARWTERGAKCLYAPRMLYPSTPAGRLQFPNIWDSLTNASCHPPRCTNIDPFDDEGTDRVSANPVP
jgi:hypothetical protein